MNEKGFKKLVLELRASAWRKVRLVAWVVAPPLVALLASSILFVGLAGAQPEGLAGAEKAMPKLVTFVDMPPPPEKPAPPSIPDPPAKPAPPSKPESPSQPNSTTPSGGEQLSSGGSSGTRLGDLEKNVENIGKKTEAVGDAVWNWVSNDIQKPIEHIEKTPTPTPPPATATPVAPTATPVPPTAVPGNGENGEVAQVEAAPQVVVQEVAPTATPTAVAQPEVVAAATPAPTPEVLEALPAAVPAAPPPPPPPPVAVLPITGGINLDSLAMLLTLLAASGLALKQLARK